MYVVGTIDYLIIIIIVFQIKYFVENIYCIPHYNDMNTFFLYLHAVFILALQNELKIFDITSRSIII